MKRVLAAFFLLASSGLANGQTCPLEEFDRGDPPSEMDETPPTGKTNFEWGSDVDPWGRISGGIRFWHYIKNLHEKKLSVDWTKTGLVIPVDDAKEKDFVVCAYDYGLKNGFGLDTDAPIITSNDGVKAAVAYVPSGTAAAGANPAVSGAEIRSDYTNESGEKASGIARLILYYFASDRYLEVEIFAGPDGEKLAFNPSAIGLEVGLVKSELAELGIDNVELGEVEKFVEFDGFTFKALGESQGELFVRVAIDGEIALKFNNVTDIPTQNTNILLFSPEGSLIAVKRLSMAALSSAK